jgi:ATP-dependent RNA helicase DeaD
VIPGVLIFRKSLEKGRVFHTFLVWAWYNKTLVAFAIYRAWFFRALPVSTRRFLMCRSYVMGTTFEELGLLPQLVQTVALLGFEQATPIQQAAIPALLSGRNMIGQAQTGTGKTAAFALPMLQRLLEMDTTEQGKRRVRALVLAPTRELAIQVTEAISGMARNTSLRLLTVYGGQPYGVQIRQIERGVDVVVGTPGRMLDLIHKNILDLSQVCYLVLDEADEMLEMGFIEDVETIMAQATGERQVALFSATMPAAIRKLADRYVSDPEFISVTPSRMTVAETEQRFYRVREENKLEALTRLLEVEGVTSALIFARTKARVQELAEALIAGGYAAEALHGDLNQVRREYVLNRFRRNSVTLLVATDVAARGLDIENVSHVINYDVPADAEDYVHRIGRTGRAGRKGTALTFFHPRDRARRREIEAYTRQPMLEGKVPTVNDIQARRDERFVERLYELMIEGNDKVERSLVARLMEASLDPSEIAVAAIRMARAGETAIKAGDLNEYEPEARPARINRQKVETEAYGGARSSNGKRQRPAERNGQKDPAGERGPRPQQSGMVRMRMNLGDRQGLRPGDVVGAIASEVGIPGRAIGEIAIHRDHTFVDISEKHARQVLQSSSGQYQLHGRPVVLTLAA